MTEIIMHHGGLIVGCAGSYFVKIPDSRLYFNFLAKFHSTFSKALLLKEEE